MNGSEGNALAVVMLALVVIGPPLITIDPRILVAGTTCWVLTAAWLVPYLGLVGVPISVSLGSLAIASALVLACRHGAHRLGPHTF